MDLQDISLQTLLTSCEEIESLIINSLGPLGSYGMILNNNGHVLVTNDGLELLQKANFKNTIQQLIIYAISNHHNLSGGQIKQFIIILTEFLRKFLKSKFKHQSESQRIRRVNNKELFSVIMTHILPEIFQNIIKLTEKVPKLNNCTIIIAKLIEGFMAGKFSRKINIILSHLLHSLIIQSSNQAVPLNLVIQALELNFNLFCICSSGQSATSSYVGKGFLIQANLHSDKSEFSGKYLLVKKCNFFNEVENVKYQYYQKNELKLNLEWNETQLCELLQSYKSMNVCLLLTSDKVSSYMLGLFKQNSLVVVDGIGEEELEKIAELSGVHIMETLHELTENLFIGESKMVKLMKLGCQHYLQLDVDIKKDSFNFSVWHLMISAPTDEMGKQYKQTIRNCLKSLMLNFDSYLQPFSNTNCFNADASGNQELTNTMQSQLFRTDYLEQNLHSKHTFTIIPQFIAVGGAIEFLIYREMHNYIKKNYMGQELAFFIECLSEALLRIPSILYKNSFQNSKSNFATISHEIINRCSTDLATIDGITGNIVNADSVFGCESLLGKYLLIENVLTLIMQLLRTDFIIFNKEK